MDRIGKDITAQRSLATDRFCAGGQVNGDNLSGHRTRKGRATAIVEIDSADQPLAANQCRRIGVDAVGYFLGGAATSQPSLPFHLPLRFVILCPQLICDKTGKAGFGG